MAKSNTNTFAPAAKGFNMKPIDLSKGAHVTVIGAGAFGGWTAISLLKSWLQSDPNRCLGCR